MEQEDIITIDFKALFKVLWKEKWLIIAITLLFTIGGTWYAFTAREEFVSEGKILPEVATGGNSGLGGLANMIGIGGFELGLKNSTDAIRPDLYPNVLASTPFFLELFNQKFLTKENIKKPFYEYYSELFNSNESNIKKKTLPTFSPKGISSLDKETEDKIKNLKERISANIDKRTGLITISTKMPDPLIAAEITKFSMDYLTQYVTLYRTEKIKSEVDFLEQKVYSAKDKYYKDQTRKAGYEDQFAAPTIRLQIADIQRERLNSEYKMSSSVYNELLKKYEESKIKLQQETPVFRILEPPNLPASKSEPKRIFIIFIFATLGIMLSFLTILLKSYTLKTK
jgi:uncharacterized protein involved in exopolysaccharide biosynthesis